MSDSDLEPIGWPSHVLWRNYMRRWQQMRTFVRELVMGRRRMEPCSETPYSWGGREIDHAQALARGMRALDCRNPHTQRRTLNDGYVRADSVARID